MITVLTVEDKKAKDNIGKIKNFFVRDSIKTEIITLQTLTVVHIIYTNRFGEIKWQKIGDQAGYEKKNIFCSEEIKPPKELGFRRYRNFSHMHRMAENAALEVLKQAAVSPDKISIGLYDPDGTKSDIAEKLLAYTHRLTVITSEHAIYTNVQKNLLEETGASIVLQKHSDNMQKFNILIAPKQIRRYISLPSGALVFTGEYPTVPIHGTLFSSYKFCLPGWCRSIKPDSLSDEYFAQALYDKAHQYTLGSILPYQLVCDSGTLTLPQAASILKSRCENT